MREQIALQLGKSIIAKRLVARLSRQELAERVGISRQAVANFEDGDQLPALETLYMIASAFDCDPSELLPTRRQVK